MPSVALLRKIHFWGILVSGFRWTCLVCGRDHRFGVRVCVACGSTVKPEPVINYAKMPNLPDDELPQPRTSVCLGCYIECLYYGTVAVYDPVLAETGIRMRCSVYPEREDCRGCAVCPKCGALPPHVVTYETYKECALCGGYFILPFPGGLIPEPDYYAV